MLLQKQTVFEIVRSEMMCLRQVLRMFLRLLDMINLVSNIDLLYWYILFREPTVIICDLVQVASLLSFERIRYRSA